MASAVGCSFPTTFALTWKERALPLALTWNFSCPQIPKNSRTALDTLNPRHQHLTAGRMKYIHSQELLEIPEGGTLRPFPFYS